ncbi:MAG: 2-C-methyl-D-erythritol 4-phosphate cytidylyltransferase [Chloroflexi bacterium]|nr:2-C-methyl-D-erythritol 4-phosphate cytidylyltransferase [Chloroflexota bacterium]MBM3153741.1 2-C-methyl-D-erythritol 4-phosphate cytidylyltransferase [Chloroflexota bacterium]MBM3173203.1 2-C-methyl-D-erythritol 4-phosphate cytidylyltransferase [Chloroflexota bacterium]MBM3174135.1 2-C-methyl-D-erythritol 4-phosphate cytidylyltransferase [Chloroflexota bacterium]MBM4449203.1 2-C-methyl-D-erythritol 4-phosphate cytidylyltransferase [Chloroflexota bacterium]
MSHVGAVVVGAGSGQRMGEDKIFLSLVNKPLLAWSVDICQDCELIEQIVIVLSNSNLRLGKELVAKRGWSKVVKVCLGGRRRQDSVWRGLKWLKNCDVVIIHDGARPFLTHDLVHNGLKAVQETGVAAAAVPVKDTIKLADNLMVNQTLERQRLWAVQTPQVFRFDIIVQAHEKVSEDVTDDTSMVEQMGYRVKLYEGSYQNIKITTPEDWTLAEAIAKERGCE